MLCHVVLYRVAFLTGCSLLLSMIGSAETVAEDILLFDGCCVSSILVGGLIVEWFTNLNWNL